jgi:hypothetical protein
MLCLLITVFQRHLSACAIALSTKIQVNNLEANKLRLDNFQIDWIFIVTHKYKVWIFSRESLSHPFSHVAYSLTEIKLL